jgi:hypothetical protein
MRESGRDGTLGAEGASPGSCPRARSMRPLAAAALSWLVGRSIRDRGTIEFGQGEGMGNRGQG